MSLPGTPRSTADRVPYAEADSPAAMRADSHLVATRMGLRDPRDRDLTVRATTPAPSLAYADLASDLAKSDIPVEAAAARLAAALGLSLD